MPAAKGKASGSKGKKGGASAKAAGSKSRNQLKTKKKVAPPKAKPKKPAARKPLPAKTAKKKPAAKPAPPKKAVKPQKTQKPAPKAAPKPASKPAPKPAAAKKVKPVASVKKAAAAAGKTIQKAAKTIAKPVAAAATAATAAAATVARKVADVRAVHAEAAPKKSRRARTRTHSDGAPIANWIQPNAPRPRPSSFIPAPPRAEAPSNTAAPPASSDRIIRPDDLANLALPAIRTFPIRVEIEQATGRTHIIVQPNEIQIRPGDGVEWDFRYLGGADTFVDEISIEFDHKLFAKQSMKSKNPGSARPHRLLSGRLADSVATGTYNYRVRCKNLVGTQVAETIAVIIVG